MERKQIYYFVYRSVKRNTAGSKAPEDIAAICNRLGFQEIVMPQMPQQKGKVYIKLWLLSTAINAWRRVYREVPGESILIFQHPSYGMRLSFRYLQKMQKVKKCKTIAVIHDLESLRGGIAGTLETNKKTNAIGDNAFLKSFNTVICHNERMRQYLISQGFNPEKLISLGVFDYLSKAETHEIIREGSPSIAIAGNLAPGKCAYIYKIIENGQNKNLKIHLFGNHFNLQYANPNMIYHGSFDPEELPNHLEGAFGLVWDGPEAVTCAGNTGKYLRYNNPHKLSLYLSAGMPVIVWREAAAADYILQNHAGIVVDSLTGLDETISRITEREYDEMRKNAVSIGVKLRSGYYTMKALEKAVLLIR